MATMRPRQMGQVAATVVSAQCWMQAWQNACQHGSTAAGPSRGPKQMGQVSSRREILAAPSAAGSCLDASITGAGSWCPVSCWRHLLSHLPLAGLVGCRQQDSKARVLLVGREGSGSTGRTLWLLSCWQLSTSGVLWQDSMVWVLPTGHSDAGST